MSTVAVIIFPKCPYLCICICLRLHVGTNIVGEYVESVYCCGYIHFILQRFGSMCVCVSERKDVCVCV